MSEEVRKYSDDPDVLFEKLKRLSGKIGFEVDKIDETNRRLMLSKGMSLLSYGENVEIIVNRERKGGSRVYVSSKPKVWFNITAQDNAKRNIQRIFEAIEQQSK